MTITWDGPADLLHGVTLAVVAAVTARFTAADWARVQDEHLDIIGLRMLGELEILGIDMDDDPIAVFCRLYLDARNARLGFVGALGGWATDTKATVQEIRQAQSPGRFSALSAHEAATSMVTAAVRSDMTGDQKLEAIARVCDALEEVETEEEAGL